MFAKSLLSSLLILSTPNAALAPAPGGIHGPGVAVTRVEAHSTDTFSVMFAAGEEAIVTVVGDGDTDLDLKVYDENGNLIAQDIDTTDRCFVRWIPRWTGRFTLRVENLGRVYNRYTIRHN